MKGFASDRQENVDLMLVNDVRNFLFGPPGAGGFDLAALNIQRGRDHGLPGYNAMRVAYGLPAVTSYADITSNVDLQTRLEAAYGDLNDIDAWVGALAEDHLPGAQVGELIAAGIIDQFTRTRDGDRFWLTNDPDLSSDDLERLTSLRMSDIIKANSGVTNLQANIFIIPEPTSLVMAGLAVAAAMRRLFFAGVWRTRPQPRQ